MKWCAIYSGDILFHLWWIDLGKKTFILLILGLGQESILLLLHLLGYKFDLIDFLGSIRAYNPTMSIIFCLGIIFCIRFY
jgi:hypothetical protein